jgi:hypothetical protein
MHCKFEQRCTLQRDTDLAVVRVQIEQTLSYILGSKYLSPAIAVVVVMVVALMMVLKFSGLHISLTFFLSLSSSYCCHFDLSQNPQKPLSYIY